MSESRALEVLRRRLESAQRDHDETLRTIRQYSSLPPRDYLWDLINRARADIRLLESVIAELEASR